MAEPTTVTPPAGTTPEPGKPGGEPPKPNQDPGQTPPAGGEPGKPPVDPPKTPEDKDKGGAPSEKSYKLKVNGQDVEMSEADLIRHAQMGMSSAEKFKSAAKIRKDAETVMNLLKTNPWKVLTHPSLGHDARKLAEEYLYQQIEEEKLSPEEREARENKKKVQKYEEERKEREREDEAKKMDELRDNYRVEYERDIIGAIETSKLPKTTNTVKRIAHYLYEANKKGIQLKSADVTDLVRQDLVNEFKALTSGTDDDILMEIVGESGAKRMREFELKRLKDPSGATPPASTPPGVPQPKETEPLSKDQWREKLDERVGKI